MLIAHENGNFHITLSPYEKTKGKHNFGLLTILHHNKFMSLQPLSDVYAFSLSFILDKYIHSFLSLLLSVL